MREISFLRGDNTRLADRNRETEVAAIDLQQRHLGLQSSYDWQKIILDTIGSNGHDREIIKKLRGGESVQSIADWLCQQHPISTNLDRVPLPQRSLVEIVKGFEQQYRVESGLDLREDLDTLPVKWTRVSSSRTLIDHLFDLYFTWVHPVHMLFSELDFKESFRNSDETYCSISLVNAVCAMACHLLDGSDLDGNDEVDVSTLSDGFMNQAKKNVVPNYYTRLTSVQTLAVMYLVDLSSGRARSATGYLRASVEFLKAAELDGQSAEAREISLWGIQTLNTYVALQNISVIVPDWLFSGNRSSTGITYQKLYAPELPHMAQFRHVRMDEDDQTWRHYRRIGDHRVLPIRPSHAVMTACHQAGLFRIIHESLNLYCGLRGTATAEEILKIYRRYLDWFEDLPPILKNVNMEAQPLPHILFLQYVHLLAGKADKLMCEQHSIPYCRGTTSDTFASVRAFLGIQF